jgi:hypothetical protein
MKTATHRKAGPKSEHFISPGSLYPETALSSTVILLILSLNFLESDPEFMVKPTNRKQITKHKKIIFLLPFITFKSAMKTK